MRKCKYRIKELNFFKNGCDISFLQSLKYYRCYVTDTNEHIAVMQFQNDFDIILDKATRENVDGSWDNIILTEENVRFDIRYTLYEIERAG